MGSRGPGETKIELDRRRINTRVAKLKRDIAGMKTHRDTKRGSRHANGIPSVAIAGYTNAGKSSILNRLTGAGVLVQNQLFATLDPTVRRSETPDGREFTFTDTVGFVRQLPHQLVEAFRSTLEEVAESDLLLHVVDGSHPDPEGQISAVRAVLADVDATDVKEVIVVNKADIADPEVVDRILRQEKHAIAVSARTGAGLRRAARAHRRRAAAARHRRRRPRCPTTAATSSAACTRRARSSPASTSVRAPASPRASTPTSRPSSRPSAPDRRCCELLAIRSSVCRPRPSSRPPRLTLRPPTRRRP